MAPICAPPAAPAIRVERANSRVLAIKSGPGGRGCVMAGLGLPMARIVSDLTGLPEKNSSRTERTRHAIQEAVRGSHAAIAAALGVPVSRITNELEGRAVFSHDLFVVSLDFVTLETHQRISTWEQTPVRAREATAQGWNL